MKKLCVRGLVAAVAFMACGKKAEETKAPEAPGTPAVPGVTAGMMTAISQFGEALGKKDFVTAYQSLRSVVVDFWGASPLILQNVKFVKSDTNTFGIYEPKAGEEYAAGEPMYLYMEPAGYTVKKNDQGKYEFGLVVIDEATPRCGIASDIAALCVDRGFDSLNAPVKRVTAPRSPVPFSPGLEDAFIPSIDRVIEAIRQMG